MKTFIEGYGKKKTAKETKNYPFGLVVCSDGVLAADVDTSIGKVDILPAQAKRLAASHAVYQLEQHNNIELAIMLPEPHQ